MSYASKVRAVEDMSEEVVPIPDKSARAWSAQQLDIFRWFKGDYPERNLVVVARAGTGKTTTIIEGITFAPENSILLAAFNKRIAEELNARITNTHAEAKTLHGIGYMLVREYWQGVRVAKGDERAQQLVKEVCGNIPFTIAKLVAKLHTKGREINPYAKNGEALLPLMEQFECDPEPFWAHQGFGFEYICERAHMCMVKAAQSNPKGGIDFADMIYLPLVNNWAMGSKELVVVDEAQDMTVAQLDLALKVLAPGGRVCVVGDPNQAIYGFRGADSASISRLKAQLSAKELTLSTTYRCAKAIVREAQTYVPDIQASEGAPEGTVGVLRADQLVGEAQSGDFILSRLNAPLAGYAMQLLREGKRAQIAGRDIGNGLKALVRKLTKSVTSVDGFIAGIGTWRDREVHRLRLLKFDTRAQLVEDQADTLYHLSVNATSIADIEATIDRLFTDEGAGSYILLSSVHKVKGLEARKVFILDWTLRRGKNQEEDNIAYVATTRAISELVFVNQV